ncbi:hypothetical protein PoB_007655100 [Plakobranchus ocellatus]|uniref:Uncharacterized protein n=1 Tax=Plakobranchus ocellatus TaxID=259542 RepID=A0AAV4E141_9GAST|nr:hypothetical protein PoB_007655100 [Plakobranchus ocellatus]
MLKVLFLLKNQESTWHLSYTLHVTVLFPMRKSTELHNASKKSKGAVMKQLMHKLRKQKDGEEKSRRSGDNVTVPVLLVDRSRDYPRNILGVIVDR